MVETLPPIPMAFSPTFSEEPRVRRIKFGDGYEARITEGLNPIGMTVSVPWKNRSHQEMAILMDFFRRHGGHRYFLYTPHGESRARKFVCPKYNYTRATNSSITRPLWDINADFYEVFDLV